MPTSSLVLLRKRGRAARLALGAVACLAIPSMSGAQDAAAESPDAFEARMVLALSDADMVPSAYFSDRLGPAKGRDALSVLSFDGRSPTPRVASVSAGNAVVGPPAAMATTPDDRYVIIIQTLQNRPADGADVGLSGLKASRRIRVVDLVDPAKPKVVQEIDGPAWADAVTVSADGAMVAIAVNPRGDGAVMPLRLYRFSKGRLGEGAVAAVPGWTPGNKLLNVTFHPRRPILALVDETGRTLTLAEVNPFDLTLTQWGNKVDIEKGPFSARFAPDGRHVLLTSSYTDAVPRDPPFAFPLGTVYNVRLDAQKDAKAGPPCNPLR